jgi:hypothetical protein
MKSLLVGTGHYLFKVYNYHDILSRLYGLGVEWFGYGFGSAV